MPVYPFRKATFINPMLLLPTSRLPEGNDWLYELKLLYLSENVPLVPQ